MTKKSKHAALSDAELRAQIQACQTELREREHARLLSLECYCDRYTCGRCQTLQKFV